MTGTVRDGVAVDADALPCGVAAIDAGGRLVLVNASLGAWLGGVPEGAQLASILTPAARIYYETHLRPLLAVQGRFEEVALDLRHADGTRVPVYLAGRSDGAGGARFALHRNAQRRAYERELVARRQEAERFAATARSSPEAIVMVTPEGVIDAWNPAAADLFGWTEAEAVGRAIDPLLLPEDEVPLDEAAIRDGAVLRDEVRRRHRDGRLIDVRRSVAAVRDALGSPVGRVVTYGDITERKRAEARVDVLVRELAHRSKNLLAIVGVIARQTARQHAGPAFTRAFADRLASLGRNQDLLAQGQGDRTTLDALVREQLAHLDVGARIEIGGPDVRIGPQSSQAVGMAIYELGTNAAKYGALSVPGGRLSVAWRVEGDALALDWRETGGPPVAAPARTGFGTRVTGTLLESAVGGRTVRDPAPQGMAWTMTAPLERLRS